jgi:hypothetical protein
VGQHARRYPRLGLALRVGGLDLTMYHWANMYLLVAVFSLCGGLLTLAVGQAPVIATVEFLMAIICATASLRAQHDNG